MSNKPVAAETPALSRMAQAHLTAVSDFIKRNQLIYDNLAARLVTIFCVYQTIQCGLVEVGTFRTKPMSVLCCK